MRCNYMCMHNELLILKFQAKNFAALQYAAIAYEIWRALGTQRNQN